MFFQSTNAREKSLINWAKNHKIEFPNKPEELDKIEKLDLRLRGIEKLPKEINCLLNLVEIHGEFNKLTDLPWEFGQLKKLKVINLGHNKFVDVPGVVGQLAELESLDLEGNNIKKISPLIANLVNITELNLSFNNITELPSDFGHLKHLTKLNLAANQLEELPANFQKLYNLVEIKIWKNGFKEIPQVLKELPNLKTIEFETDETKIGQQLISAVVSDDVPKVERLLSVGADINYKWLNYSNLPFTTPLFEAHSVEMVKFLLEKGADPNLRRDIPQSGTVKVWESEKKDHETFLTKKHNPEIVKFLKTLPNLTSGK